MNHEPWLGLREELRQARIVWASAFPLTSVAALILWMALCCFVIGVVPL